MPLLFPDDLDEEFVPGTLAYECEQLRLAFDDLGTAILDGPVGEVLLLVEAGASAVLDRVSRIFHRG